MYRTIGNISVYDLIGTIDLLVMIVSEFLIMKKSALFPGNTAKFLMSYSVKSPADNIFTRMLSSEKFWIGFEKRSLLFMHFIVFLLSKDFSIKILHIGNDYYGVIVLSLLLLMILSYIFRLNICKFFDLITPYLALHSSILKLACFFNGCCSGYECSFGFYNMESDAVEFPIQLIESFLSLILFCLLLRLNKKNKLTDGALFPLFTILYSANRLLAGFFRDEERVFLFLTDYQITSFYFFIIGIILMIVFLKFNSQINLVLNREPFPGYMKYKRSLQHNGKINHKSKN